MMVACAIVAVVIRDQLAWIAYLVGGALFFFCLSAATGILQTVRTCPALLTPHQN